MCPATGEDFTEEGAFKLDFEGCVVFTAKSRENHSNVYLAVPLKFILNSLGCCIFPKGIMICFVLFQLTLLFRDVLGSQQK